jgi:Domain of unknown function (DUF5122) beta-propeller
VKLSINSMHRLARSVVVAVVTLGCSLAARGQCLNWHPDAGVPGIGGPVRAITTWDPDGDGPKPRLLVLGGTFTNAQHLAANHIVAWDGAAWLTLGGGMTYSGTDTPGVFALTVYNGELVAGGHFTTAGGISANRIARWDGTSWRPLGTGMDRGVFALAEHSGSLVAGGVFSYAGDALSPSRARWDGTTWHPMGNLGEVDYVYSLAVHNGQLHAAGYFNYIARWDGAHWQPLAWVGPYSPRVYAMTEYDGALIVGGSFTQAGTLPANFVARLDGTSWQTLGSGTDNAVRALIVFDGELIAAGDFTLAGGTSANRVARWNGTNWRPLGSGTNATALAMTISDGDLIVGGEFDSAGGAFAGHWARWGTFLPGDLDGDGAVGLADLSRLLPHFGQSGGPALADGNIDGDEDVDLTDLAILLGHFGEG